MPSPKLLSSSWACGDRLSMGWYSVWIIEQRQRKWEAEMCKLTPSSSFIASNAKESTLSARYHNIQSTYRNGFYIVRKPNTLWKWATVHEAKQPLSTLGHFEVALHLPFHFYQMRQQRFPALHAHMYKEEHVLLLFKMLPTRNNSEVI